MEYGFREYKFEIDNGKARITKVSWDNVAVEVPEKIEGYEVTEIGDYALSRAIEDVVKLNFTTSPIEEVALPRCMKRIGRYAFYNCRNLKRICFYNTLEDIGAGAFTGCHSVREIEVTFLGDESSCLKELLMELPEEQTLIYHSEKGEARLVFPEFFEEAVENTPARILETHTHGSGMMYRNCFVQKKLEFHLYDERFEWAKGRESSDTLFRLVFGRLLYPYELSEKAKEKYIEFLKEHLKECARWAVKKKLEQEVHFLAEHCINGVEELDYMLREAAKQEAAEMTSYLMDYKHRKFEKKRKTFEL